MKRCVGAHFWLALWAALTDAWWFVDDFALRFPLLLEIVFVVDDDVGRTRFLKFLWKGNFLARGEKCGAYLSLSERCGCWHSTDGKSRGLVNGPIGKA